jgi:16S rRNA (cytidine1402-2'-O)-methyltransferase
MAGTLFVVATPIGNLEDITHRALRVLREANLIAAEDTRRTSRLLAHYSISTKLISVHEHNERSRVPVLLRHLAEGQAIALVTDAGTPGASDPGMHMVQATRAAGYRVEPVPGPSAIITALSVAGEPFGTFWFAGFPPIRLKDRKKWLSRVHTTPDPIVLFEAPHRVRKTLAEVWAVSGKRPIIVCRELTKVHEEVFSGSLTEILDRIGEPRGEFTIVLGAAEPERVDSHAPDLTTIAEQIRLEIGQLPETDAVMTRRQQLKVIAQRLGIRVSDVYRAIEASKSMSNDQ